MSLPARLRSPWAPIVGLALLGLTVRLAYVLSVRWGGPLSGDGVYYHEAANLLADGLGFTEPYRYLHGGAQEALFLDDPSSLVPTANTALPVGHVEPTAGHPPLWVLVLGAASFLGLTSVGAHQVVAAVVGALGVVAVAWAGRRVEQAIGVAGVAVPAAALAAVHAGFWLNDAQLMSETLVVPLAALLLGIGIGFVRQPAVDTALLLGLVGGLAAMTRAELLVALPLVALGVLRRGTATDDGPPPARRLGLFALVGATAVVVLSPWVVRNLVVFEEPVLLSNGTGILLAQANCDATYFGDKQGYWEYHCGLPQPLGDDGRPVDESQRDASYRQRGLDYLTDHPGRLATHVVPKRVGRYWGAYAPIQQLRADELVEERPFRLSVLGYAQFLAVVGLAVVGVAEVRRRGGPLLLLTALPITGTVVAAATFGSTRYRVPAEVALVLLAAVGIATLVARRRGRRGADPVVGAPDAATPTLG